MAPAKKMADKNMSNTGCFNRIRYKPELLVLTLRRIRIDYLLSWFGNNRGAWA